jgi:hypothetical protein
MASAYQNLLLEQGTTFLVSIVLDDIYGNNYNLTNFLATSKMRKSYYSSNGVISFSTSVDVPSGTVTLSLPANTSANLVPGRYVYDTVLSDDYGNVVRVLEGVIDVSPSVTR